MSENTVLRNIMINKAGGKSGSNTVNYRISLPAGWMQKMGISIEDRSTEIEFNEEDNSITIRKKKED